jgi:hypothetical protein
MLTNPITRYTPPAKTPPEIQVTDTSAGPVPPRSRRARTLMAHAIVYVSLALAIYIVLRGDTAQLAMVLPYLAGLLQLVLKAQQ